MQQRFESLDGIRGILAVFVMLSHIIGYYGGWQPNRAFVGVHLCVFFFFIMSGFVLSYSYSHSNQKSLLKYALLRLARLFPLMLVSTLLMLGVYNINRTLGGYVSSDEVFKASTVLNNILFLHGVLPQDFKLLNEPSWSISLEFWVSMCIPVFFMNFNKIAKLLSVVGLFVLTLSFSPQSLPPNLLTAILCMFLGSLAFDIFRHQHLTYKYIGLFATLCLVGCLVASYELHTSIIDYVLVFLFLPCLWFDKFDNSLLVNKILRSKPLLLLGRLSFPLYLLHEIVIVIGIGWYGKNLYSSVIIVTFIAMVFSYFYTIYIDEPMYAKFKDKIKNFGSV